MTRYQYCKSREDIYTEWFVWYGISCLGVIMVSVMALWACLTVLWPAGLCWCPLLIAAICGQIYEWHIRDVTKQSPPTPEDIAKEEAKEARLDSSTGC